MKRERKTITTTARVYLKQLDEQIRLIDEGSALRRQVRELSRRVEALQGDYELQVTVNNNLNLLIRRLAPQALRVIYSRGDK